MRLHQHIVQERDTDLSNFKASFIVVAEDRIFAEDLQEFLKEHDYNVIIEEKATNIRAIADRFDVTGVLIDTNLNAHLLAVNKLVQVSQKEFHIISYKEKNENGNWPGSSSLYFSFEKIKDIIDSLLYKEEEVAEGDRGSLYTRTITCPICNNDIELLIPKAKLTIAREISDDYMPLKLLWTAPQWDEINPYYYRYYDCLNCGFIDGARDLQKYAKVPWSNYTYFMRHWPRYGDKIQKMYNLLELDEVNYENLDQTTALKLCLGALLIQLITPDNWRDAYKIGRGYHHLSWLLRFKDERIKDAKDNWYESLNLPLDDIGKRIGLEEVNPKTALMQTYTHYKNALLTHPLLDPFFKQTKMQFLQAKIARLLELYTEGRMEIRGLIGRLQKERNDTRKSIGDQEKQILVMERRMLTLSDNFQELCDQQRDIEAAREKLEDTNKKMARLKGLWRKAEDEFYDLSELAKSKRKPRAKGKSKGKAKAKAKKKK